ncbi:MAG: DUF308 domain-containing protein [Bacillota bacterium]|jgi:uncharacterized membrane protein HdeD (DUF308 family)
MAYGSFSNIEKKRNNRIIFSFIFIIFGIFLLFYPQKGMELAALLLGLILLVFTVLYFVQYIRSGYTEKSLLAKTIITLFFAILLFIFKSEIASVVLPFIIGLGILVIAVICIITAIDYKKQELEIWWMPLIGTIISVVVSLLIFNNLQATSNLVAILIGIFLLVFGAFSLFEWITVRTLLKKLQ